VESTPAKGIYFHPTPVPPGTEKEQGFLKIYILWATGDSIQNWCPTQCQESILPLLQSLKIVSLV